MIQERFDVTVDLIQRQGAAFYFLQQLLNSCRSTVLVFSFFKNPSAGNERKNILITCQLKAALAHGKENSEGYLQSIAGLETTIHTHICVSIFITDAGTFTIFSDFALSQLTGALFEPTNPLDPPTFSHLFVDGKLLSPERE